MFGDVTGERKLDEDAMDFGVIVGFFDLKEEFCLCDGLWELDDTAEDVGLVVKLLVVMILLRGKVLNILLQRPLVSCAHMCL